MRTAEHSEQGPPLGTAPAEGAGAGLNGSAAKAGVSAPHPALHDHDDEQFEPAPAMSSAAIPPKKSFFDKLEAYISRLSTRNNFWHRVCSIIWLPLAAKSGIRMKRVDATTFAAVLPFRRFNRNWYNAMAGAALLANSEIAGGMYVFGVCGGDYTVVCKHLQYRFLRPCFGPAIYRLKPREAIEPLIATGREFNLTVEMDIIQQIKKLGGKDRRVGRCEATFHVTPKAHHKQRRLRDSA
ncbi:MAG: hypothetical protein KF745_12995 [Phycisphaeraceae bacterium]|nr:hypothetical protein [Phycisphaeraceae bacterium]